jgi:hypothetical protein
VPEVVDQMKDQQMIRQRAAATYKELATQAH